MIHRIAAVAFVTGVLCTGDSAAQQTQGCFSGTDAAGTPARMVLQAERYGQFFEVWGQVFSQTFGVMQIKADGWSGAGRLFRSYEDESGSLYIQISDFSAQGLVLQVEGYGRYPFHAVPC